MDGPLSIVVNRSKRRKAPIWVTLFPVAVSFLSLLAFGIFLALSTLNTDAHTSTAPIKNIITDPRPNTVPDLAANAADVSLVLKGDVEAAVNAKISTTKRIEDRINREFRPSTVHPNNVLWPKLLDRPADEYPVYDALYDLINEWNPDDPDPPALFRETLQHFNYSDPYEREKAALFRDAEIPFKLYDVPEVEEVVNKWNDDYLLKEMLVGNYHVEKSKNNHFMYWTNSGRKNAKFVPPTTFIHNMSFKRWLEIAKQAEVDRMTNASEHYYFMTNTPAHDHKRSYISRDLPFLSTEEDNFFITNTGANKGIQCRFGMRGVIAEAHYDSGRNMVVMLKGRKRYLLTPPSTCDKLGIIADPSHPSYRHSEIDWSNLDQAREHDFMHIPAIDTIVQQGEVLYIPSFWFHYIISLQYSIQCNSRSGTPPKHDGKRHIEECLDLELNFDKYNGKKNLRIAH
jgi:oxalate decarboxylase/phosphoglucose isomerase-like protein (cupin superfamily)